VAGGEERVRYRGARVARRPRNQDVHVVPLLVALWRGSFTGNLRTHREYAYLLHAIAGIKSVQGMVGGVVLAVVLFMRIVQMVIWEAEFWRGSFTG
jgi:hypothetical protein